MQALIARRANLFNTDEVLDRLETALSAPFISGEIANWSEAVLEAMEELSANWPSNLQHGRRHRFKQLPMRHAGSSGQINCTNAREFRLLSELTTCYRSVSLLAWQCRNRYANQHALSMHWRFTKQQALQFVRKMRYATAAAISA